jgi:hypothetical protein
MVPRPCEDQRIVPFFFQVSSKEGTIRQWHPEPWVFYNRVTSQLY